MEDLMQALHNLRKSLYQLTDDISEVMAELSTIEKGKELNIKSPKDYWNLKSVNKAIEEVLKSNE